LPAPEPEPGATTENDRDLALIADAARAAGEIARSFFGRSVATSEKGGGQGPVTEADLAIEAMLRARLTAARPDYGWLSEEAEDSADRLGRRRVFIVDPIDGTRAFIAGQKSFGIAIAVAEAGRVVAGVMHLPLYHATYAATRGGGASRDGTPLRVSARQDIADASALAGRAQLSPELWPGGAPPVRRHFRPALAHRLCLVAEGRFDCLITLAPCWEWDVAAGALIAAEAGAAVTTAGGGAPAFNSAQARLPGLIAAPPALHAQLMARLAPAPG